VDETRHYQWRVLLIILKRATDSGAFASIYNKHADFHLRVAEERERKKKREEKERKRRERKKKRKKKRREIGREEKREEEKRREEKTYECINAFGIAIKGKIYLCI
jgi:hypothetical protein